MTTENTRLELKKVIMAPVEKVFAAWTKPELLSRWLSPGNGSTVLESVVDLKVGGRYRIRMKGEMNGMEFDVVAVGIYEQIVPNRLLSFTWSYEDDERRKLVGDSTVTVALTPIAGGTELTLIHEKLASEAGRRGHEWGWINCMEKLEKVVAA